MSLKGRDGFVCLFVCLFVFVSFFRKKYSVFVILKMKIVEISPSLDPKADSTIFKLDLFNLTWAFCSSLVPSGPKCVSVRSKRTNYDQYSQRLLIRHSIWTFPRHLFWRSCDIKPRVLFALPFSFQDSSLLLGSLRFATCSDTCTPYD